MQDAPLSVHRFLASLVADRAATAKVSTLWERYRSGLTQRERRRAKRREFVEALKLGGLIVLDRSGAQQLLGFSADPLPTLLVNQRTGRLIKT